jgi:hypothetical protein
VLIYQTCKDVFCGKKSRSKFLNLFLVCPELEIFTGSRRLPQVNCPNSKGMLLSQYPNQEGNKIQRQKILMFIYPIYNHNWINISTIYIYIKRKEIFSPSNKIHRGVGRAKDLSAPLYYVVCTVNVVFFYQRDKGCFARKLHSKKNGLKTILGRFHPVIEHEGP